MRKDLLQLLCGPGSTQVDVTQLEISGANVSFQLLGALALTFQLLPVSLRLPGLLPPTLELKGS
ncbi:MAG: hypothetical protein ACKPKO_09180, partial [Candidatus Fonsibacter sp.]